MYPNSEMMEEKSNWGFMIGINIPLYSWRKQSDLSAAATIDKEAALLEKRNVENRLNTESLRLSRPSLEEEKVRRKAEKF